MAGAAPVELGRSFLTVEVGGDRIALPASEVTGVIKPPPVMRVPLGPKSLVGIANLRGTVLPVVSLRTLFGADAAPPASAERVVIVDRGTPVGLVVDRVASLGAVNGTGARELQGDPESSEPGRRIDIDSLLAKEFVGLTRRSHQTASLPSPVGPVQETDEAETISIVSFEVAGQDFALPLDAVREILPLPETITFVPHSDVVMLGVMAFRARLLPMLSLQALLGFRSAAHGHRRSHVVVVAYGDALLGLVTDGMKEVLRIPARVIDPVPRVLTRGSAEAEIQGICRLDGGRRLVSLLSPDHLLRNQEALGLSTSDNQEGGDVTELNDVRSDPGEQFVIFRLGEVEYGLPIGSVDEIVRIPDTLTKMPRAPDFIEGVMNLRGRVVPVIDQRRRFDVRNGGRRNKGRVIIVTIREMQAGFAVDDVLEVLRVPEHQVVPTPELTGDQAPVIDRIANLEGEGRMILLLDPRELLDQAEKDLLASMDEIKREYPSL